MAQYPVINQPALYAPVGTQPGYPMVPAPMQPIAPLASYPEAGLVPANSTEAAQLRAKGILNAMKDMYISQKVNFVTYSCMEFENKYRIYSTKSHGAKPKKSEKLFKCMEHSTCAQRYCVMYVHIFLNSA